MNRMLIVAEIGGNHAGNVSLAMKIIDAAKIAGADAVKFQVYRSDKLVSVNSEYFNELSSEELSDSAWAELKFHCDSTEIEFMGTPFDVDSAKMLYELGVKRFKVASGDITFYPLLDCVGSFNLPVLLSTGASGMDEIRGAINRLQSKNSGEITLMHCTVGYPTPDQECNLARMSVLKEKFGLPVGFSDHTLSLDAPVIAYILGATVWERHFTIDRELSGGDNTISILPEEMTDVIKHINQIRVILGEPAKHMSVIEIPLRKGIRRGGKAVRSLDMGYRLELSDLVFLRPEDGISPEKIDSIVGKRLLRSVKEGEGIREEDLS